MIIPEAYELVEEEYLKECRSQGLVLRHKKTGAKLFILSNDDENKVFTVGFRTPPEDSAGVPHILEHSVLCGSEKYPVKDPFIELAKSSLNTFLNAMTYPDKTIYPVASCNEKDFKNLMSVYMDAVFAPAIYREEKIFRQEGWHLEMEDPDGELFINGVVYNEMKGAFSSPEDVLERYCQNVLYPDTPYTHESGGDPDVIPTLTYEKFLDFHSRYYHPSNSYIYLYGDLDMTERLEWLDREYLGKYDFRPVDSALPLQAPFDAPREASVDYPLEPDEDPAGKSYLSLNWVAGEITDPLLYTAFQVLETVLLNAPGAPVKQALTDAGLGADVYGGYQNAGRQPYFNVVAKYADEERKEEFVRIVRETLEKLVKDGLNRRSLQAAINSLEFRSREADFGPYPKGLMIGIECFDSWLYDASPFVHLRHDGTFAALREKMEEGYFEELIRRYFLENPHCARIILHPVPGLTEKKDEELAKKLADYRDSLSEEERDALVKKTRELKEYQSAPSAPEALATLPKLALSDIRREADPLHNTEKSIGSVPVIHHEIGVPGIVYLGILFRADGVEAEDVPWLGLLRSLFGLLPTEHYSYSDLFSEVNLETGGIGLNVTAYQSVQDSDSFAPFMEVRGKALKEKLPRMLALIEEILLRTNFRDEKRLRELLTRIRTRTLSQLQNAGHTTAVQRAASYESPLSAFHEKISGIDYLRFLTGLGKEFETEEGREALMARLEGLARKLYVSGGMLVSLTAESGDFALLAEAFPAFAAALPAEGTGISDKPVRAPWPFTPDRKNEGFKTAAQIQYVGVSGNFRRAGFAYTGALRVLTTILANEYLWDRVRVLGGAYGCMCRFGRNGGSYLVSYRDPNLKKTLDVYAGIVPYLTEFSVSEEKLAQFIIGTVGSMDHPFTPSDAGVVSLQAYLCGLTQEMRQRSRDEVLGCTAEDIRALAPYVQAVLDADQLCVVGNAGNIEAERELFRNIESLN